MINVRIKTFGKDTNGDPAYTTTKVFIRESNEYEPLKPGEVIALEDNEAEHLVELLEDYLEVTTKKPNRASPPPRQTPLTPANQQIAVDDDVVEIMRGMDLTDGDLWTADSIPRVDYLESVLGRNVPADVRDVCWEVVLEERRKAEDDEGEGEDEL